MNLVSVALLNGILDLGIVLALAAVTRLPFVLDRAGSEPATRDFAEPLPLDLAA